ncbi:MAG: class I adenylate-forming enzyme family protein [Acidimicrobiia bacterium]
MDLALLLDMAVRDAPDRHAITDADGTTLTRGELMTAARRAATRFSALGASRIGYLATNGRALPVSLFGAAQAGVPFVPINYRLSDEQLADVIAREPSMALVATPDARGRAPLSQVETVVAPADLLAGTTAAGDDSSFELVDPDSIAVRLYTSGTTAEPKAAVLRHRHLTSYVIATTEFGGAEPDEAALISVPPYHIAGVTSIISNLYCGRRIVYLDTFDPVRWCDVARRERITHAMVVPTMLARILECAGDEGVPTLRSLAYGGAKMPTPVIERALERLPDVDFTNAYGLTETSSTITVLGPDEHRAAMATDEPRVRARLSSAGKPVPGVEIVLLDERGQPCEPGVVGDILVRGEQVSGEYGESASLAADRWFPTRDRGWLDEDGYLFVAGRSDDTIIRGGENIAPAEIEDALERHPAVKECAVVGVADDEWGQRIAAVVVRHPGHSVSADELRAWVRDRLRGSKTPDLIEFCSELPYTDTGKLLRRALRDRFHTAR